MKKVLCLMLTLMMVVPLVTSCRKDGSVGETAGEAVTAEDDRFAGIRYNGRSLNIQNSIDQATAAMTSSNAYIEGSEEVTGDAALDSAIRRNNSVEELLDVDLVFSPVAYNYGDVPAEMRQLVLSGDATYQLIINDIWGCMPLTAEGIFRNVASGGSVFDFSEPWWYDDFMSDISLDTDRISCLAGDFFLDHLRNTHCLVMNKTVYSDLYGDPDAVYQSVLDDDWTIDDYNRLADGAYLDLDGDGEVGPNDQFGSIGHTMWSCCIPWLIAGDPGYIERDEDGHPVLTVDNENSYTLAEKLCHLYASDATVFTPDDDGAPTVKLASGQALFLLGSRLGSLESGGLRGMEADLAVLPYPKRDDTQATYVSAIHDTTEIGFIPATVGDADMPFLSTVIEVLCRETNRQVLPVYYESSLKIKYTRDKLSGQMIDIIHDHYGSGFALTWSVSLGDYLLYSTLYNCIAENSTHLASKLKSQKKQANAKLAALIEQVERLEN